MIPEEEKQDIQLHFRVTRREKEIIDQKMALMGTKRLGVYLRKMAIDGYYIKIDMPEIRELITQIRRYGNNLNQMAKCANETSSIFEADLVRLQRYHDDLFQMASEILRRLSEL